MIAQSRINVRTAGYQMPKSGSDVTLNTTTPTSPALGLPGAKTEAHGRVPDSGAVTVEVDGACTVSIYVYSLASNKWRLPGADSASYQKVFAGAGYDFFQAPPGALFRLVVASGTVAAWHSGDAV